MGRAQCTHKLHCVASTRGVFTVAVPLAHQRNMIARARRNGLNG
jgi:hypothetical protein